MDSIAKSILNQMWIYTAALKTMYWLGIQDKYSKQVDITIDNLYTSSLMLFVQSQCEQREAKCQ